MIKDITQTLSKFFLKLRASDEVKKMRIENRNERKLARIKKKMLRTFNRN